MRTQTRMREWLALSALTGCAVAASATGCGGSTSVSGGSLQDGGSDSTADGGSSSGDATASSSGSGSTSSGGDDGATETGSDGNASSSSSGGSDAGSDGTSDSGSDASGSSSGGEGGADSGVDAAACSPAGSACTGGGITAGLCVGGACSACNSPSDDANCTSAYGGGTTPFICNTAGACVAGNCHADTDCITGQICGVTTANTCGACTTDSQCQLDPTFGPSTICGAGACVTAVCATVSTACVNGADFCCPSGSGDSCVPGNCCTSADCAGNANGTICGAGAPNQCGKCTLDSQCSAGQVCNTTTGACVTNTGLCTGAPVAAGGQPGSCSGAHIGSDVCCHAGTCFTPATGATECCPGTAGNTYCQTQLSNTSAVCTSADTCTTCGPVSTSAPVYFVDPVNGSDGATGSAAEADGGAAAESCALKTVTRALQLISVVGTTLATKIVIVGGTGATVGAGETFPLVIPTNVTVTTQTGAVTVQVATGKAGFALNSPSSNITGGSGAPLTITTTINSGVTPATGGTDGIDVGGSAASATTTISNLTITGMLDDGIRVNKGSIAIGAGVVSNSNGITTAPGNGLHVTGTGAATIAVPAGSAPTTFVSNTAHGILVDTNGSVALTGVVTSASAGTGTVVTNGNVAAGVWIQQTPGASVPQNVLNGLVSFGNTGGNGLRIVAGSSVQVRNSVFLSNQANGVIISTYGRGGTASNDISKIDLGSASSNGGNTFQAAFGGGSHNGGAGICLATLAGGTTLSAVGNQFSAANCATTASTLSLNATGCANSAARCPSGVCDLGLQKNGGTTANTFNVSMCTQ